MKVGMNGRSLALFISFWILVDFRPRKEVELGNRGVAILGCMTRNTFDSGMMFGIKDGIGSGIPRVIKQQTASRVQSSKLTTRTTRSKAGCYSKSNHLSYNCVSRQ